MDADCRVIYLPHFDPKLASLDDEPDYLPTFLSNMNRLLWEFFFSHLTHRNHVPQLPVLTPLAFPQER
jgi:hypothetical protein